MNGNQSPQNTTRTSFFSNIGQPIGPEEHHRFTQNQDRALFLRNLPYHFRDEHLMALVSSILDGRDHEIELCRVKYCRQNGVNKPMQVGYALLSSREIAQEVLDKLEQNPRHGGRDIRGSWFSNNAGMEESREGDVYYEFQANTMATRVTEEVVRSHMEHAFGPLRSITIRAHFWKPSTNEQSGFGFLSFEDELLNTQARESPVVTAEFVKYLFSEVRQSKSRDQQSKVSQTRRGGKGREAEYIQSHNLSGSSSPTQDHHSSQGNSSIAYPIGNMDTLPVNQNAYLSRPFLPPTSDYSLGQHVHTLPSPVWNSAVPSLPPMVAFPAPPDTARVLQQQQQQHHPMFASYPPQQVPFQLHGHHGSIYNSQQPWVAQSVPPLQVADIPRRSPRYVLYRVYGHDDSGGLPSPPLMDINPRIVSSPVLSSLRHPMDMLNPGLVPTPPSGPSHPPLPHHPHQYPLPAWTPNILVGHQQFHNVPPEAVAAPAYLLPITGSIHTNESLGETPPQSTNNSDTTSPSSNRP